MKVVFIFGNRDNNPFPKAAIWEDAYIKYFQNSAVEECECLVSSYHKPDVIINLDEPSETVKLRQRERSVPCSTQVIDLY